MNACINRVQIRAGLPRRHDGDRDGKGRPTRRRAAPAEYRGPFGKTGLPPYTAPTSRSVGVRARNMPTRSSTLSHVLRKHDHRYP